MTELGLYIDEEILLRSQATDLIRCKSVCKSWHSLISSPRFVKSHLKRQDSNETGDTRITVSSFDYSTCHGTPFHRNRDECKLVGSSNGLVCVCRYDTDFIVVNPSTREVKELSDFPECSYHTVHLSGFGYDSSTDDFKVVIGSRENPNDYLSLHVLELKTNIWRSVYVEEDYEYVEGNGILCNGALHWLDPAYNNPSVIVSFDLSKEVFKKIPLPKLDVKWILGTMKDRLCVFPIPDTNLKEDEEWEIWVLRNDQVSWEQKLPPPGYDGNKIRMTNYMVERPFLSGDVHIWLLEEGSCAPVLVRSMDYHYPHREYQDHQRRPDHEHIRLSTYSECNYNYDEHVFVKSLVSPHGMGNENGSCNEKRVKRKRKRVISPDGHDADCDGDGRRVKGKRRERESHVFHTSRKGSAKLRKKNLVCLSL